MVDVIGDAIAVAIVAFAISVSMAQLFAKRHNYECDSNQVRALIALVIHETQRWINIVLRQSYNILINLCVSWASL